jgi:hypothetical protein
MATRYLSARAVSVSGLDAADAADAVGAGAGE